MNEPEFCYSQLNGSLLFDWLKEKKILSTFGQVQNMECSCGAKESLVFVEKTKATSERCAYFICSSEASGKVWFSEEEVKKWRIDPKLFLAYLVGQLGLSGELYPLSDSRTWRLGMKEGVVIYYVPAISEGLLVQDEISLFLTPERSDRSEVLSLADLVSFDETLKVDVALFESRLGNVKGLLSSKGQISSLQPTYSYVGIEIYCQDQSPFGVLYADVQGARASFSRDGDKEVLKALVQACGDIVSHDILGRLLAGMSYDELYSSNAEIHRSVSRLRSIKGMRVKSKRGVGYFIPKK